MSAEDHVRKLIEDMHDFTVTHTILVRRWDEILFGEKDPDTAVEYSRGTGLGERLDNRRRGPHPRSQGRTDRPNQPPIQWWQRERG